VEERALRLPGDELVPAVDYNQAISIDAHRAAVWPWLGPAGVTVHLVRRLVP